MMKTIAVMVTVTLVVTLLLVSGTMGHAVLTCPAPRSTNPGEKRYPAGYNFFGR